MSCDVSCDCGHMPLYHLRNKKRNKKEKKEKSNPRK